MSNLPLAHEAIIAGFMAARRAEFGGFVMELDAEATTSAEVIVPDVWAQLSSKSFKGRVRVAGSPAVVEDDTLVGQAGETITFPKWDTLGELEEVLENEELAVEQLGQTDSTATIKEVGKAVQVTDRSKLVGLGNAQDEATRQFGILAARKVDADLITEAVTTPVLTVTAEGPLTYSVVVDALAEFGDDADAEDFAFLAINSAQRAELARDDQYIAASQGANGNEAVLRGQIGTIAGVPIVVTDRITAGTAALIKKGALGLFYKARPVVETERHARARATDVVTHFHYAVKRINDEGVCVITLTEPEPEAPEDPIVEG